MSDRRCISVHIDLPNGVLELRGHMLHARGLELARRSFHNSIHSVAARKVPQFRSVMLVQRLVAEDTGVVRRADDWFLRLWAQEAAQSERRHLV